MAWKGRLGVVCRESGNMPVVPETSCLRGDIASVTYEYTQLVGVFQRCLARGQEITGTAYLASAINMPAANVRVVEHS